MIFCLVIVLNKLIVSIYLSAILLECQTVWIQTRPDISSGLVWVQTDCKGYQQMTLAGNEFKALGLHDISHKLVYLIMAVKE